MNYIAECIKIFNELPQDVLDKIGSFAMVEKVQEIEKDYKVDLKLVVVLVTINELSIMDIPDYLNKQQGIAEEVGHKVMMEMIDKVFSVFFDSKIEKQILTIDGLLEIFSGNILGLLKSKDEIKDRFNKEIGYLLFFGDPRNTKPNRFVPLEDVDPNSVDPLQLEFVEKLEKNKEVLSKGTVTVAGKYVESTISNWIKAFDRFHEGNTFDTIAVSKFITSSEGSKQLSNEEKQNLRNILNLYRITKYFPDSLLEAPVDKWYFVPIHYKDEDDVVVKQKKEQVETEEDEYETYKPKSHAIKKFTNTFSPWIESEQYLDRLDQINKKHGLSEQQKNVLENIMKSFMNEKFAIDDLPKELQTGLAMNAEAVGLILRDVYGQLVKPIGQYISGYGNFLLENLGVNSDDYPEPDNILTILNQIAIVKQAKVLEEKEQEKVKAKQKQEKVKTAAVAQKVPEVALELQEKLKEHYKKVRTEKIKHAQTKFTKLFTKEEDFTKQFYLAINDRNIDDVIGALWVLAEKGKLLDLLKNDKKIQNLYNKHLTSKYGDQVASDFETNPSGPAYLSYFLKHLLVDSLKMSSSDSAAFVIHLSNEIKQATGQEVEMLAFGDMETQEFVWRKIEKIDGKLILENS